MLDFEHISFQKRREILIHFSKNPVGLLESIKILGYF